MSGSSSTISISIISNSITGTGLNHASTDEGWDISLALLFSLLVLSQSHPSGVMRSVACSGLEKSFLWVGGSELVGRWLRTGLCASTSPLRNGYDTVVCD